MCEGRFVRVKYFRIRAGLSWTSLTTDSLAERRILYRSLTYLMDALSHLVGNLTESGRKERQKAHDKGVHHPRARADVRYYTGPGGYKP